MNRLRICLVACALLLAVLGVATGLGPSRTLAATPAPTPASSPTADPGADSSPSPDATPSPSASPSKPCSHLNAPTPSKLVELAVTEESVCANLSRTQHVPAISALTLFSVRRPDKLLVATLEVARLQPAFDPQSAAVQGTITGQIGDTVPERLKVSNTLVYVSQARGLTLLTWFRKKEFYVLAVRDIFDRPRAMLREALEATK